MLFAILRVAHALLHLWGSCCLVGGKLSQQCKLVHSIQSQPLLGLAAAAAPAVAAGAGACGLLLYCQSVWPIMHLCTRREACTEEGGLCTPAEDEGGGGGWKPGTMAPSGDNEEEGQCATMLHDSA